MPTYAYKCPHCGAERDVFLKSIPKSPEDGPACDLCDTLMEKQLTAPAGFDLRGGGYYVTDFRGKQ